MTGRALVGAARSQDLRRLWVPPARSVARGVVYLRTHGWADHSRLLRCRRAHRVVGGRGRSPPRGGRPARSASKSLPRGGPDSSTVRRSFSRATSRRSSHAGSSPRTGSALHTSTAVRERPATRSSTPRSTPCAVTSSALTRIQVTHAEMHDLVLSAGVEPCPCFPHPDRDRPRALSSRRRLRHAQHARADARDP